MTAWTGWMKHYLERRELRVGWAWVMGVSLAEICQRYRVQRGEVHRVVAKLGLPKRRKKGG